MNKFGPAGRDQPRSGHTPLIGKTILITRPRDQADAIAERLERLGGKIIHFPTIEVIPPSSWEPVDSSIARLQSYDWIIFTSANGARFFLNRVRETGCHVGGALAKHVVCAIGPATARAVEAAGALARVTASDSKAEGALTAIVDHLGGEQNVRGLRFLIPRARVAREALPAGLRRLGAYVDAVETYQTVKPDVPPGAIVRLFKETSIDAVTFTSSSTVSNFAELAGLTDLSGLLAATVVACIGPVTAETAARYGLTRVIQPGMYSSDALVEAIVESIGEK
jgi:uroporphyrinogen III methyltransferase / synthase